MKNMSDIVKFVLVFLLFPMAIAAQPVRVGLAKDASEGEFGLFSQEIRSEIEALTLAKEGVVFKELSADWQTEAVRENLHALLNDSEVDVVITLGYLSSEAAADLKDYPKPVIAATILDPELQGLPDTAGHGSGIANFAWIESLIRLKSDVHSFARIFSFSRLAVILPGDLYSAFPDLVEWLQGQFDDFDVTFVPLEKDESVAGVLPAGTDAVMVFPLIRHSGEAIRDLFRELNTQGIPSLSLSGVNYLEHGATVSFTPQFTFQQMARQVAVRVIKASEGTDLADVPAMTDERDRVPFVNMESLRLTGRYPQWSHLADAVLFHVAEIPGEKLSLHQALGMALENNLEGKITEQNVLMAQNDVRLAKSLVLPHVEVSGTGVQLSENLVESSMGQRGEYTVSGSVSLKQVIYSEAAYANIALKKLVAENARHSSRQTTLDIVLDVSEAYISLLFAKNNLQIKNQNVTATLQNLELAKAREESGEGRVSDVNRWISELNLARMELNDARAGHRAAMYRLNELLDLPAENAIATPDSVNLTQTIIPHQYMLDSCFVRSGQTEHYADFLISEMMFHSPELQQLATAGEMIDRQKVMKIRQMYLPEVALIGSADQAFVREGVIRNPQLPVPPPPDDITWNLGLRVSIPLFEGGSKRTEIQRAAIEQDKMAWQKDALLNKMETGIRSNVQFLQASYRELKLSEDAARAAEENYHAVQDAYAQGMVNVAQLIDARNVMTRTSHVALGSHYQYILDYIRTERLQGNFSFLDDETEKELYVIRLLNHLNQEEN